jgi:uncharacterized protein (TIGR03000 family)
MYTVVLMAALTAGSSTPAWGWGCHGGCGGGCHGGLGLFRGCHGGSGGCWGGYGGCSGGYGGCYGGYGGCYGGGYTCYAGYGLACYGCYGRSGCYGGGGCYNGYGLGCTGSSGVPAYAPAPVSPSVAPPGKQAPEVVPPPKKEDKSASLSQARLIVELPADAKLYVDDRLMRTTSERRIYNSPLLEAGQTYYYILRAEVVREGQTLSDTKRVLVHAGDVIQASFRGLESAATARAQASAAP